MQIRCRKCKSTMTGSMFLSYISGTVFKKLAPPVLEGITCGLTLWMFSTRNAWDDRFQMFVNGCEVPCSKCKTTDKWEAFPEPEPTEQLKEIKNQL